MSDEVPQPPPAAPGSPGLPPVAPPSGRFIAQLFLVPGLIVVAAVLLLLGANYLFTGGYNPDYFLRGLSSDNPDVWWRHASDLAQVLKRSEPLKADAKFALDLAGRFEIAQKVLLDREKAFAAEIDRLPEKEREQSWNKLNTYRNHVILLAGCFGEFYAPVGLPLIAEALKDETSPDAKGHVFQRRQLLLILASMGENQKKLANIPAALREKMILDLQREARGDDAKRSQWARNALLYVDPEASVIGKKDDLVLADDLLDRCSTVQDQYQREQVALVLALWNGPKIESTLRRLAKDSGFGATVVLE